MRCQKCEQSVYGTSMFHVEINQRCLFHVCDMTKSPFYCFFFLIFRFVKSWCEFLRFDPPSRHEHKRGRSSVFYLLFCSKCKYFREIILCFFIFLPLWWEKKKSCEKTGVFVDLSFFSFLLQINWQQMCVSFFSPSSYTCDKGKRLIPVKATHCVSNTHTHTLWGYSIDND